MKGVKPEADITPFFLAIDFLNPSDRLNIADRSEITLRRCQACMSQEELREVSQKRPDSVPRRTRLDPRRTTRVDDL